MLEKNYAKKFVPAAMHKLFVMLADGKPDITANPDKITDHAKVADLYYTIKQARLAKDKEAEALKDLESAAQQWLIDSIDANAASGVAGTLARVTVVKEEVYTVSDWDAFQAYVAKNRSKGSFALLQKRANTTALKEVAEQLGAKCTFAAKVVVKKLSVNKL